MERTLPIHANWRVANAMNGAKTARMEIHTRQRWAYDVGIVHELEKIMTLCPVAMAVGCAKCPIYKPCPLKGVIGDAKPDEKSGKKVATPQNGKPKKK